MSAATDLIIALLEEIEQDIWNVVTDAQTDAEAKIEADGGRYDDHTEDEDGNPVGIVYPENAAPHADHARTLVRQAIEELQKHE